MFDFHSLNVQAVQAFMLVAEHGSFRKSAEVTGRSASVLSTRVKELESQLGVSLFDRTTRRLSLTLEGSELLDHARKAFSELQAGFSNVRNAAEARSERVRFACLPTLIPGAFPPALAKFNGRHPNVTADAVEFLNEDLVAAVKSREVEFGIGVTVPDPDCEFTPICRDEMCALVSSASALAGDTEITMRRLIMHPVILAKQATPTLKALQREARAQLVPLELRHRFSQPQSVASMSAAGHGVGVLPRYFVETMGYKGVRVLRITEPSIVREVSVISLRGVSLSRSANTLVSILRSELQNAQKSWS